MRAKAVLLAAVYIFLAARSEPANAAGDAQKYRGHFTIGFETSKFEPCGKKEQWWVGTGSDALVKAAQAAKENSMGQRTIYVEITGKISTPGRYGHLGAYERKIEVERVITSRAARPNDCN